jgi:hypothetical protein
VGVNAGKLAVTGVSCRGRPPIRGMGLDDQTTRVGRSCGGHASSPSGKMTPGGGGVGEMFVISAAGWPRRFEVVIGLSDVGAT